jgi:hypothetical protein
LFQKSYPTHAAHGRALGRPHLTPGLKRFGEYGVDFDRDLEPLVQDILSRRKASMLRSSEHRLGRRLMEELLKAQTANVVTVNVK